MFIFRKATNLFKKSAILELKKRVSVDTKEITVKKEEKIEEKPVKKAKSAVKSEEIVK